MSKHLTVTQTAELLEELRVTVQEFAAAEEKLNREHQTRSNAAQRRFQEDLAAHDARAAEQLQEAERQHEATRISVLELDERRKARINTAYKSARQKTFERIDNEEGKRRYQSQKGLLDTQRWRTDSLAQNEATLANLQHSLAESRARFDELEQDLKKALSGFGSFRRSFEAGAVSPQVDVAPDEYQILERLNKLHDQAIQNFRRIRGLFLPRLFSILPLWVWIAAAILAGAIPQLKRFSMVLYPNETGYMAAGALFVLGLVGYLAARAQASKLAATVAAELETARQYHAAVGEKGHARHASEIQRIETESQERTERFQLVWKEGAEAAASARETRPRELNEKWQRAFGTSERLHADRLDKMESGFAATLERIGKENAVRRAEIIATNDNVVARFRAEFDANWQKLVADWNARIQPIRAAIAAANQAAAAFAPWTPERWKNWPLPLTFGNAAKAGSLEIDLRRFAGQVPRDPRLAIEQTVSLPLVLTYPQQGSVLFETTRSGNEPVFDALNNIIFRLLSTTPAGKLSFTIIDPVKLGQNFSSVMHLADYEDNVINGRIWTQPQQIDERLAELNEHMEKVIQMYLRNEYETIAEYNLQAGNIAEKYHFVVVADFPANFTDAAAKRLLRIAASGARCGVFTLIHWDHRHTAPPDFIPEELRKSSVCITAGTDHYLLANPPATGAKVLLDEPPAPELATEFLHKVGQASRGSNRVEVPFDQVAPAPQQIWTMQTTEELRVPIGRSGATKLQYLAVGKGTRQHALVAGKTGSGKSTLFHVIITNLALWCPPEEVEFYLVDFKKGVEFKAYARRKLPHARVVAIESDREFGLSVLQRLDEELKRRGELFRKMGVQDVPGYKRAGGNEQMPRTLLLIDEFQEFFVEDDRISQTANLLLDRIVRQGRAFGIHVVLGSQTLGGAYTLARTTIGQMVVRIALQCNEADAYLIMDENNPAPRLLSRPGEGIYNDAAGAIEANSPFQAVWIDDEERDLRLQQVRERADERYPGPIVFEGNAPADVQDNPFLKGLLAGGGTSASAPAGAVRLWLGAPNSIKGPTEAVFTNRSGNNLLVVGQRDEAILAMVSVGLVSLGAQLPRGKAKFIVFDSTPPGSAGRALLERVVQGLPHETILAKPGDMSVVLNGLVEDLGRRTGDDQGDSAPTFLLVHGVQNFKKLRQDDDFGFSSSEEVSVAAQFQKLITEGPAHGIHIIATLDTFNNLNRFLGRKALSEFEMRVLFQMSANDSASLCDDPKASNLGLHRALLYNEQEGYLETFRPYALPDNAWFEEAGRRLAVAHRTS